MMMMKFFYRSSWSSWKSEIGAESDTFYVLLSRCLDSERIYTYDLFTSGPSWRREREGTFAREGTFDLRLFFNIVAESVRVLIVDSSHFADAIPIPFMLSPVLPQTIGLYA